MRIWKLTCFLGNEKFLSLFPLFCSQWVLREKESIKMTSNVFYYSMPMVMSEKAPSWQWSLDTRHDKMCRGHHWSQ